MMADESVSNIFGKQISIKFSWKSANVLSICFFVDERFGYDGIVM